ncbi:MAG: GGDEF domain-containing protein [Thermodesulfobacteriota bacterium]|nr:GGDEF domain-containing protein [Thermodesulfobacteriota bacterium]
MKRQFALISKRVSDVLSVFLNVSVRQSDHRRLSRYIIELNQKKSSEDIIAEAADCLKHILGYRVFAFVIKTEKGLEVWLDPKAYKGNLEPLFMEDFEISRIEEISYTNQGFQGDMPGENVSMKSLVSYDLFEEHCRAKIYMLPKTIITDYHEELVNIILKSTGVAISRQRKIEQLTNAAAVDPLTGCYNRRELEKHLQRCISSVERNRRNLSIFMFDIDHFKQVNDTYGHQAGDTVLKEITRLVQQNIRTEDILARFGGEEFLVVLPGTGRQEAMEMADRLRHKISTKWIKTQEGHIRITASFGVAAYKPRTDMTQLVKSADTMLYKAKLAGRNLVMPGLIKICSKATSGT